MKLSEKSLRELIGYCEYWIPMYHKQKENILKITTKKRRMQSINVCRTALVLATEYLAARERVKVVLTDKEKRAVKTMGRIAAIQERNLKAYNKKHRGG